VKMSWLAAAGLLGLGACVGKRAPEAATGAGLPGTWWLADTESGPVRARLTFKNGTLDLDSVGAGTTTWRVSPDGSAWEARGPDGATLLLDDRGPNGLIVQGGDRIGLAWRAESLPSALGGAWRWRSPDGEERAITLLGGPVGQPARLVLEGGGTGEVWALRRGEGELSLVIVLPGEAAELWHAHRRDLAYLLWTGQGGTASTLFRPGQPPIWVPVGPTP
jgi:hypothetical protein